MKKIITVTLALGLTTLLIADANMPMDKKIMKAKTENNQQHKMAELVPLPHLKRVLQANKELLKLTKEQKKQIKTQIYEVIRADVHKAIKTAEPLEAKITNAILIEQKTKEDMKADIEALIDIKRTITNGHIDALNTLGKILTKEQYQQILEFIATNKEKDKH